MRESSARVAISWEEPCRREDGELCFTPVVFDMAAPQLGGDAEEAVVSREEGWAGGGDLGAVVVSRHGTPCCPMTWRRSADRENRGSRIGPGALQLARSRRWGRLRGTGRKRQRGQKGRPLSHRRADLQIL